VREQVENALNAIAREYGKVGYERPKSVLLNDLSVAIADFDSVHRQFYQCIEGIVVVVKYALS